MYRVTMVVRDLVWFVDFKLVIPATELPALWTEVA